MTVPAITTAVPAAVVHVERSHPEGALLQRPLLDGRWPLRQKHAVTIAAYLDQIRVLLPVAYRSAPCGARRLEGIDVRWVTGWALTPDGRAVFTTVAAPQLAHLVGAPSPVLWLPAQGWPVRVTKLPVPTSVLAGVAVSCAAPAVPVLSTTSELFGRQAA